MTADHIGAAGGGFEPQRANNFMLELTPPGGDGRIIQQSLSEFPFPKEASEEIAIPYINEIRKVAGRTTYEDLDLVLNDYVDQDTAAQIEGWRRLVYVPEAGAAGPAAPGGGESGSVGWAKDYKVDGSLILFGPDGTVERTWTLVGVWPKAFNMGSGSMEGSERVKITCTLAIDKMYRAV